MEKQTPKSILIATGIYPPQIGGPATYSKLLFDELPKKGIKVEICCFADVNRFPKIIKHIAYAFLLFKKSFGKDLIFAQDTVSVGFPALVVSKILRKNFFLRVPGDYAWEQSVQRFGVKDSIDEFQKHRYGFKVELLRFVQRRVASGADCVITPSHYFSELVSLWIKDKAKVHTIYNGIDFPLLKTKEQARAEKSFSENDFIIVSAGRLVPWKGFFELIEAVSFLVKDGFQIKLYILGEGPDMDKLKEYISTTGVSEQVFLVGQTKKEEMFSYLCASDLFMLNSSFESFSFQTVEAMSVGTLVAVSRIGSLPELVTDGTAGLLFDVNNREQMIECIKKAMSSELRNHLSSNARQRSLLFSIENTITQLLELFRK